MIPPYVNPCFSLNSPAEQPPQLAEMLCQCPRTSRRRKRSWPREDEEKEVERKEEEACLFPNRVECYSNSKDNLEFKAFSILRLL